MLIRCNVLGRLVAVACLVMATAAGNAASQDINNPVFLYHQTPAINGAVDSIVSAKATFDPLPQYGTRTKLTIEHYALFATDSGMMVELRGEAVEKVMLRMPQYAKLIPGPIAKGDTLVAEFWLTPEQVGRIPLSVMAYDNIELIPDQPVRVGVMDDISFMLGADGRTFGVASTVVSGFNSTVLGPAPNLLSSERVFHVEPRYPQPDLKWLNLPQRPNYSPEEEVFAVEVRVLPVTDRPSRRLVSCRIFPYQDFEYGIACQVVHSDELKVTELDTCILGAVSSDSVYEMSFVTELAAPGLGNLAISFITPNADFGVEGALFSARPRALGAELSLTIGISEDLEPLLITDVQLRSYLKAARREEVDPVVIDQRFAFVNKYWQEQYEMHTVEAPRFDFVMVHRKP